VTWGRTVFRVSFATLAFTGAEGDNLEIGDCAARPDVRSWTPARVRR